MDIRRARPEEFSRLGRLLVDAYAALPGMPRPDEQPDYYGMLLDVARRAAQPAIDVFAAVDDAGAPIGCVDFIRDVRAYGSGGSVATVAGAVGIRLLAVAPAARGHGVGKALTEHCMREAHALGAPTVVLHTTRAMQAAWAMYERLGFRRFADIDFQQGKLEVFGFRYDMPPPRRLP
jgi:ribosomal protein S18 acetylase RimI-like enzyme